MNGQYISLLSSAVSSSSNYVSLVTGTNANVGGETAGSVARSMSSIQNQIAHLGGETAGSVACGSTGSTSVSSSCGSFSAIA